MHPDLFILSDSHGACVVDAAVAAGRSVVGGPIEGGRNVNIDFYAFDGRDFRFHNPPVDALYRSFLTAADVDSAADLRCPVLCTFAGNFHYLARSDAWEGFRVPGADGEGRYLSAAAFHAAIKDMISGALAFHADLVSLGLRVLFALPPRRVPITSRADIFLLVEQIVPLLVAQAGAEIIDLRHQTLDETGAVLPRYAHDNPDDETHGSLLFGQLILDHALAPQSLARSS